MATKKRTRTTVHPLLVARRSGVQGRGVYARRDIPSGTRLIEYTGERISNAEADRRDEEEREKRHHTFLFILDEHTVIDARYGGNASKYINHFCDPNCEALFEGQHIWIYSTRDIQKGDELGYDYEYDWEPHYTMADLAQYACFCGSPKCRGTMVDLPPDKLDMGRELLALRTLASA
jgi:SET domain-containing protein